MLNINFEYIIYNQIKKLYKTLKLTANYILKCFNVLTAELFSLHIFLTKLNTSDVNRLKNLNRLKMSFNRLIIVINRLIAIKNFNRLID